MGETDRGLNKVIYRHLLGGNKEKPDKPQSRQPNSQLRIEAENSRIHLYTARA
jgi:hypothetical protein